MSMVAAALVRQDIVPAAALSSIVSRFVFRPEVVAHARSADRWPF